MSRTRGAVEQRIWRTLPVAHLALHSGHMEMPQTPSQKGPGRERVLREIGETMLMIEAAVARADRALKAIDREEALDPQHRAALVRARRDLETTRRRLHQEAYLYADLLPLE